MPSRSAAALLCLAALAAAGCKKPQPEGAAPAPVTGASAGSAALSPTPAEAELSLLEPAGKDCEWKKVALPSGAVTPIARFPGSCVGARVAWSPDLTRAAIWFDPTFRATAYGAPGVPKSGHPEDPALDGPPRLYTAPRAAPLPEPKPRGALNEVGVSAEGVVAFSVEELPDAKSGDEIDVEGKKIILPEISDGMPALAHAYRLEGQAWKRVETAPTTWGWDYAMGPRGLAAWKGLGPRTGDLLDFHALGDEPDAAAKTALAPFAPKPAAEGDGWSVLHVPQGDVFGWTTTGEFAYTTGLLVFRPTGKAPALLPELGFTRGDLIAVLRRGPYLLAAANGIGAWPRVYDLRTGKLVYSSDTARAAVFMPEPGTPSGTKAQ